MAEGDPFRNPNPAMEIEHSIADRDPEGVAEAISESRDVTQAYGYALDRLESDDTPSEDREVLRAAIDRPAASPNRPAAVASEAELNNDHGFKFALNVLDNLVVESTPEAWDQALHPRGPRREDFRGDEEYDAARARYVDARANGEVIVYVDRAPQAPYRRAGGGDKNRNSKEPPMEVRMASIPQLIATIDNALYHRPDLTPQFRHKLTVYEQALRRHEGLVDERDATHQKHLGRLSEHDEQLENALALKREAGHDVANDIHEWAMAAREADRANTKLQQHTGYHADAQRGFTRMSEIWDALENKDEGEEFQVEDSLRQSPNHFDRTQALIEHYLEQGGKSRVAEAGIFEALYESEAKIMELDDILARYHDPAQGGKYNPLHSSQGAYLAARAQLVDDYNRLWYRYNQARSWTTPRYLGGPQASGHRAIPRFQSDGTLLLFSSRKGTLSGETVRADGAVRRYDGWVYADGSQASPVEAVSIKRSTLRGAAGALVKQIKPERLRRRVDMASLLGETERRRAAWLRDQTNPNLSNALLQTLDRSDAALQEMTAERMKRLREWDAANPVPTAPERAAFATDDEGDKAYEAAVRAYEQAFDAYTRKGGQRNTLADAVRSAMQPSGQIAYLKAFLLAGRDPSAPKLENDGSIHVRRELYGASGDFILFYGGGAALGDRHYQNDGKYQQISRDRFGGHPVIDPLAV